MVKLNYRRKTKEADPVVNDNSESAEQTVQSETIPAENKPAEKLKNKQRREKEQQEKE